MLEVSLQTTFAAPWTRMPPVRVGQTPTDLGTPDVYGLVQSEGEPLMRIDVYMSSPECFAFEEALVWSDFIIIGYGSHVYLISLANSHICTFSLEGYFGHFYPAKQFLLIASASHLHCVDTAGLLQWTSECLGIDGVMVDEITEDFITGQGEWNPPGGWKPFEVNVQTGKIHTNSESL